MFRRRDLIATGLAASCLAAGQVHATALPVPPGGRIGFRMLRNGDAIGTHELAFSSQGDALTVAVAIDIAVKFAGIPLYRYRHRATERWQAGQFISIESQTDRDGAARQMRAMREKLGVVVEGTLAQRYVAPPVALPTTYWNRAMVNPALINSEDGTLLRVSITEGDMETLRTASGRVMTARHYSFAGPLELQIWYDEAGQWAHLEFTKDGSTIIYDKL